MQIFSKLPLLLFAVALFTLPDAKADKVVMKDLFHNPHQRTRNITIPASQTAWQKDIEITNPAGRILLRYFAKDTLKKVELKSADSGKILWQTTDFSKPAILCSTTASL